jgi:predicted nucleic acid-binding protein
MNILDSNLFIYSALSEYAYLRPLIKDSKSCTSAFSMLEVLGFHRLDTQSKRYFENVFYSLTIIPISEELLNAAIILRQQRKLSAGDSLIAATALHYDYALYTRNTGDFDWIPNLQIVNPIL